MSEKTASRLAWSAGIAAILLTAGQVFFMFIDRHIPPPAGMSDVVNLTGTTRTSSTPPATPPPPSSGSSSRRDGPGTRSAGCSWWRGSPWASRVSLPPTASTPVGRPGLAARGPSGGVGRELDRVHPARGSHVPADPLPDGQTAHSSLGHGRKGRRGGLGGHDRRVGALLDRCRGTIRSESSRATPVPSGRSWCCWSSSSPSSGRSRHRSPR